MAKFGININGTTQYHLVAKLESSANGAIWWPRNQSLTWIFLSTEYAVFVAGEITQVINSIPWQCKVWFHIVWHIHQNMLISLILTSLDHFHLVFGNSFISYSQSVSVSVRPQPCKKVYSMTYQRPAMFQYYGAVSVLSQYYCGACINIMAHVKRHDQFEERNERRCINIMGASCRYIRHSTHRPLI